MRLPQHPPSQAARTINNTIAHHAAQTAREHLNHKSRMEFKLLCRPGAVNHVAGPRRQNRLAISSGRAPAWLRYAPDNQPAAGSDSLQGFQGLLHLRELRRHGLQTLAVALHDLRRGLLQIDLVAQLRFNAAN